MRLMTYGFSLIGLVSIAVLFAHPVSRNLFSYFFWSLTFDGAHQVGHVEHGGADIAYRVIGQGSTLVLLHGGLGSRLDWFSQIPVFVRAGHRVVLIDTRGHGASTIGNKDFTYRNFAADVISVLDKLNIAKSDFVGWSDGGNTALRIANLAPQRVKRLALISSNFSPEGLTDPSLEHFPDSWLRRLKRRIIGSGDPVLQRKVTHLWQNFPRMSTAELAQIETPTLLLLGEHDAISLEHGQEMAHFLIHGQLRVLSGAGHNALVTDAQVVNQLILDFLDR